MSLDISEIISTEECSPSKVCESFVFEPDQGEEDLGTLIVLCEAESKHADDDIAPVWFANYIAYKSKTLFYGSPQASTREAVEDLLGGLNEAMRELRARGDLDWLLEMNVTLSAFSSAGEVYLSQVGENVAFVENQRRVRRLDVASGKEAEEDEIFFQEISQGTLSEGSKLILLSSNFRKLDNRQMRGVLNRISYQSQDKARKFIKNKQVNCFAVVASKLVEEPSKKSVSFRFRIPVSSAAKKTYLLLSSASKAASGFFSFACGLVQRGFSFLKFSSDSFRRFRYLKNLVILLLFFGLLAWGISIITTTQKPAKPSKPPEEKPLPAGTELRVNLDKKASSLRARHFVATKEGLWAADSDSFLKLGADGWEPLDTEGNQVNFALKAYDEEEKMVYVYTPPFTLSVLDIAKREFQHFDLDTYYEHSKIVDEALFRDNLYFLDARHNQVIKYQGMDFQSPQLWMKEEAKAGLGEPLDFAIDGSIYILSSSGEVGEYRLGRKVSTLDFGVISPKSKPLLYTKEGFENIYLYTPGEGLIKVYAKKSDKVERKIETVPGGIDFTVQPKEDQAFILTADNKIYTTQLTP